MADQLRLSIQGLKLGHDYSLDHFITPIDTTDTVNLHPRELTGAATNLLCLGSALHLKLSGAADRSLAPVMSKRYLVKGSDRVIDIMATDELLAAG